MAAELKDVESRALMLRQGMPEAASAQMTAAMNASASRRAAIEEEYASRIKVAVDATEFAVAARLKEETKARTRDEESQAHRDSAAGHGAASVPHSG